MQTQPTLQKKCQASTFSASSCGNLCNQRNGNCYTLILVNSLQIKSEIEADHGVGVVSADMIVALFLVTNGADIHLKNHKGQSPLSACTTDLTTFFKQYSERR